MNTFLKERREKKQEINETWRLWTARFSTSLFSLLSNERILLTVCFLSITSIFSGVMTNRPSHDFCLSLSVRVHHLSIISVYWTAHWIPNQSNSPMCTLLCECVHARFKQIFWLIAKHFSLIENRLRSQGIDRVCVQHIF